MRRILQEETWKRAGGRCEYCCNTFKGPNIGGIDPEGGRLTRLYHLRLDHWEEHFSWSGVTLTGLSAVGRATIAVLKINDPDYVAVRQALLNEGVFP